MQETWRLGHEDVADNDGSVFVGRGLDEKPCRRGSQGVGLWLSRGAAEAWETAGRAVLAATPRLLAIRLSVHDARGRHVSLVLASGYAPHSGMDLAVSDAYYADVDALHAGLRQDDVLVFGTDANATIGIEKSHLPRRSRGPNGLDYINNAGRRFLAWLSANGLASAASFYVSGLASDATWFHPRSRLPHAPDHFVVRTCDIKRVVNCRKLGVMLVDSDHYPVKLTLRLGYESPDASRNVSLAPLHAATGACFGAATTTLDVNVPHSTRACNVITATPPQPLLDAPLAPNLLPSGRGLIVPRIDLSPPASALTPRALPGSPRPSRSHPSPYPGGQNQVLTGSSLLPAYAHSSTNATKPNVLLTVYDAATLGSEPRKIASVRPAEPSNEPSKPPKTTGCANASTRSTAILTVAVAVHAIGRKGRVEG